jgi:hypothetical protein
MKTKAAVRGARPRVSRSQSLSQTARPARLPVPPIAAMRTAPGMAGTLGAVQAGAGLCGSSQPAARLGTVDVRPGRDDRDVAHG